MFSAECSHVDHTAHDVLAHQEQSTEEPWPEHCACQATQKQLAVHLSRLL